MAQGGDPDGDEPVLSPDELDIEAREEVASIGDDRYVIGQDGPPDTPDDLDAPDGAESADGTGETDGDADTSDDAADPDDADDDPSSTDAAGADVDRITGRDVKQWLDGELADRDSAYAYRIAAKSGDQVTHQQLATDDVTTAFDGLLVWYAEQVADDTPVEEALGILLAESGVRVRYPTERLVASLEERDLDPDDSIRDLVESVAESDGLAFPPR